MSEKPTGHWWVCYWLSMLYVALMFAGYRLAKIAEALDKLAAK
jgi:hypothetical protein